MTPLLLTGLLAAVLLATALAGPLMLRSAAPALVRTPRVAIAVLVAGMGIWLVTLLALGPLLAWVISGPVVLPDAAGEICRRCLASANPFHTATIDTGIPGVVLLAAPAVASVLLLAGAVSEWRRRGARSTRLAQEIVTGAPRRTILGHRVHLIEDEAAFAFTLPARRGGIVISTGAVGLLDAGELAAVLAHEQAHLRQRHHLLTNVVAGLGRYLRWVPLVAAVQDGLPHYVEIAADNQARRRTGTHALVSALLALGERAAPTVASTPGSAMLHAAGPERIGQLVRPVTGVAGAVPAAAVAVHLLTLTAISAAVLVPYASAAVRGCL